jgi:mono/diheme cytochrome c family protein
MKTSLIALGAMGLLMAGQAFAADAAKGKSTFDDNCSVCHNSDSTERKMGPGLKGLFKHEKLANGKPVNEGNVQGMINEGGNGMPPFADVLTKTEKDDVVAFLKSL